MSWCRMEFASQATPPYPVPKFDTITPGLSIFQIRALNAAIYKDRSAKLTDVANSHAKGQVAVRPSVHRGHVLKTKAFFLVVHSSLELLGSPSLSILSTKPIAKPSGEAIGK